MPHSDRLYGYAVALCRDRDGARDLLHDCIARAMATRDRPSDEAAFRAWLFRILRNLWIDRIRADKRRTRIDDQWTSVDGQGAPGPVSMESMIVNAFAVRQAFGRLSHDHRDILALVDISGFSYDETARILEIPPGTVMSRVSRARRALAALLSDTGVEHLERKDRSRR
jgi:RNA polymerase sigma-70 factor (ECF subfamily)